MVGRTDPYTFYKERGLRMTPDASLDKGLDVLVDPQARRRNVPRIAWQVFGSARHVQGRDLDYAHDASHVLVTAAEPFPVQVDGDPLGRPPASRDRARARGPLGRRLTPSGRRPPVPYPEVHTDERPAPHVRHVPDRSARRHARQPVASGDAAANLAAEAANLPKLVVNERELSDLEMLATGALSPLTGFQGEADYHGVLETHAPGRRARLGDPGGAWASPTTSCTGSAAPSRSRCARPRTPRRSRSCGSPGQFKRDKHKEALSVYRTDDLEHPGVKAMYDGGDDLHRGRRSR